MDTLVRSLPFFVLAVLTICLIPQPAQAYLDPGTGSYALQSAMGVLFAFLFYARTAWQRVMQAAKKSR